jgi:hypothetical protein
MDGVEKELFVSFTGAFFQIGLGWVGCYMTTTWLPVEISEVVKLDIVDLPCRRIDDDRYLVVFLGSQSYGPT